MKTWQAFLAQLGTLAAQAAVGTMFFNPTSVGGVFANTGVQIGAQAGLLALQGWIASKNSNTDPNGNPLVKLPDGTYVSAPK